MRTRAGVPRISPLDPIARSRHPVAIGPPDHPISCPIALAPALALRASSRHATTAWRAAAAREGRLTGGPTEHRHQEETRLPNRLAAFAALRHRNFRLLWAGQMVSVAGSMMQTAALLWQVSLLAPPGRKGIALGTVGLVRVLPIIVLSLVGGVVADAKSRRPLMLATQSALALLAAGLAYLTLSGRASLPVVYIFAALTAAATAFDAPARQALMPNLVPRADLPNALSLMTILFQVASVAGPSLAGIVIATRGVGFAYALNAISFLAVIGALAAMREVPEPAAADRSPVSIKAAVAGLRFVFRAPLIRGSMFLDFFATFFSSATTLLPIFVQDVLKVGPRAYGWLYAAPAVGAFLAGIFMVGAVDRIERRGRILFWAVAAYGLATVGFGVSRWFPLTYVFLALTGATDTVSMVLRNIIRQLHTPDSLRGRMTSVNMVFFMGGPQLGELEAGVVAQLFSAPVSVISGGLGCLLAVGWIAARTPQLRRYRRSQPVPMPEPAGA
jgi:MFS family permease